MIDEILVKDLSREYTSVSKDTPVTEAFWKLDSRGDTHLVVEEENTPIGVISIKDFARVLSDKLRRKRLSHTFASALMTPNPIFVEYDTPINHAIELMLEKGISSLLVKFKDHYEIVTKRDILGKKDLFGNVVIEEIMTKNPIVVPMGTKLAGAENMMREKKITVLPVVEEGELIGHVDIRILSMRLVEIFLKKEEKHPEKVLREITLGDIMQEPILATPETPSDQFIKDLIRRRYKGSAIVVSEANPRVIGVVTETDLVRNLIRK